MEPNVIGYALQDLIFVIMRLLSAGVITGAALYIGYHQWFSSRLAPTYVWSYVGICLTLVAFFRWFVVIIALPDFREVYDNVEPWLQPLTQAGYVLVGMCFFVITYGHIKGREAHHRHWHDGFGYGVDDD